ncbi:MAG: M12 family metallo-peptidase [Phycisphaerales bacterium]
MKKLSRAVVVAALFTALAFAVGSTTAAANGSAPDVDPVIRERMSLSTFVVQSLPIPAAAGAAFGVPVRLGDADVHVAFEPHSVRAPGFKVVVQDATGALNEIAAPAETTYRGSVVGLDGAIVAGNLTPAGLSAFIRMPDGQAWFIDPISAAVPGAPRDRHVVYRERDGVPGDWRCGMNEMQLGLPALKHLMPPGAGGGGSTDGNLVCEIACDADFEFYTSWASNTTTVTNDITGIVNLVSNIYEADCQVEFTITQIIIRTSAATNPYTSSTPATLLGQFRAHWLTNHTGVLRDLAHLFTGRNLDGSTIGIAYLNGVCNTNAFGLSQSRWTANTAFRVGLTAHETGHNFSAPHCDSVCSPCEIMCSGLGGCSGIVTSFSTCDIASITSYAATRPCLTPPPPPPPPALTLPFFDPFPQLALDPLKWSVATGASVSPLALNARSEPYALQFYFDGSAQTKAINTDAVPPVFLSFWSQHSGVEAGKALRATYFDTALQQFAPLLTITSNGVDQPRFSYHEITLPFSGFSATSGKFAFATDSTELNDAWFVDDVRVSLYCRADVNQDRQLSVSDFGAFQTAYALGNAAVADFNDDGVLSVSDFGAYQTRFVMGCY